MAIPKHNNINNTRNNTYYSLSNIHTSLFTIHKNHKEQNKNIYLY